ncbi:hypothetical protein BpHYR1_014295 [Brachionus plicatilis]|uniref:Uncharacterized protein n=1 Tax=Brachionus plicatilis TaxID=10195 RepID=A0A3M7R5I9_BRAPC|nr:hypothetical protein BpHYR1_014295 [Brachionus plicatilis]
MICSGPRWTRSLRQRGIFRLSERHNNNVKRHKVVFSNLVELGSGNPQATQNGTKSFFLAQRLLKRIKNCLNVFRRLLLDKHIDPCFNTLNAHDLDFFLGLLNNSDRF